MPIAIPRRQVQLVLQGFGTGFAGVLLALQRVLFFQAGAKRIKAKATKWPLKTSETQGENDSSQELMSHLNKLPKFPKECFFDLGIHTGNISKKVILTNQSINAFSEEELETYAPKPVREGKQINPFHLAKPEKHVLTGYKTEGKEYWTIRQIEKFNSTQIVIRQTAPRPIAAIHSPKEFFRNSALGCNPHPKIPAKAMVCILNSQLIGEFHTSSTSDATQKAFPQVKVKHLRNLPCPTLEKITSAHGNDLMMQLCDLHDHISNIKDAEIEHTNLTSQKIEKIIRELYGLNELKKQQINQESQKE